MTTRVTHVYEDPRSHPSRDARGPQYCFTVSRGSFAETFTYESRERAEDERAKAAELVEEES